MEIYLTKEVKKFIASQEAPIIAKVLRTIDLLEQFGNQLQLPHSKSIGQGLFELRISGYKTIRIFYGYHNQKAILFHGFIKKTQQIPKNEINIARRRFKEIIKFDII